MSATPKAELLWTEGAWTFADLQRAYDAIEDIALGDGPLRATVRTRVYLGAGFRN